ncbi:YqgE/AlgH family protein [Pseudomaricurvus sp. HS19]|uniref:YqgE/AlgH family protein n=1 Tax=Pseudomaricurvus sp. HS19 TaxID=2692626 RepID=UPI001F158CE0|nr:YqgE/AlgH family protein [Pseudomaricurvus sp. HS19]
MSSLRNHFLIAMPSLNDSIFSHTITYVCEHDESGAMGLVINQPLGVEMDEIYRQLKCSDEQRADTPVLCGGPVQPERGFILHPASNYDWESSLQVSGDVSLTASRDIIDAIANGTGPQQFLIALGYAGWAPGQLEDEIANNAWLTLPADSALMFDTPIEQRWGAISRQLGIDLNLISGTAGHA